MTKSSPEAVSSVLKVFHILEALSEQKDWGVTELAQRLMTSKATTYRFLQTMKQLGFVKQDEAEDKYALTLKLFELGSKALEYVELTELADKEMRKLAELTQETVHLGTLDGQSIIYTHKIDSSYSLRMHSRVGRRNPLYSTAIGKVLLAGKSDEEVRTICEGVEFTQQTEHTLANVEQLLEQLVEVRAQHYAQDNEEQEPGLRCLAAPIYDRFGNVIAGVSLSFPIFRFDNEQFDYYVKILQTAGSNVSEQLGYHDYPA